MLRILSELLCMRVNRYKYLKKNGGEHELGLFVYDGFLNL